MEEKNKQSKNRKRRSRYFTGEDIDMLREKNSYNSHRSICDTHEDGA